MNHPSLGLTEDFFRGCERCHYIRSAQAGRPFEESHGLELLKDDYANRT
jgi:hypothetical protein